MQPTDERVADSTETFRVLSDAMSEEMRVAIPGIISKYDEEKQTVEVIAALREQKTEGGKQEELEIPPLADIPVYFPGGQGFDISYPVKAGDECLVVFADMCIDAWWESGGVQNQTEKRRHDLSDGFALVGFRSQQNLARKYNQDAIVIAAEESLIEVYKDRIYSKTERFELEAQSVEVKADTIKLAAANVQVNASEIHLNGSLHINGEPYVKHRHSGVQTGGGTTGGKT